MPAAGGDALALQIALVSLAVLWRRVPEPVLICAVGLIGVGLG